MRQFFCMLFITILTLSSISNAATNHLHDEQQVKYLIDQAQFLAQHGIAQEEVLQVFEQSLTSEELNNAKPHSKKVLWTIAGGCVIGAIIIGCAVLYLTQKKPQQQQASQNNLPPELVALFDDNAFTQEAQLQNRLEPMIAQAVHLDPQIADEHRQHIQALQERDLPRMIETAAQMRQHYQNPAIAEVFEQFLNQHPELEPILEDPARMRRLDAIHQYSRRN